VNRPILTVPVQKNESNSCAPFQDLLACNAVTLKLNPGVGVELDRPERHFYTTFSGGVCGKASIEPIEMQGCPVLPPGLHAAALFSSDGTLQLLREDVGRNRTMFVNSRASFELVQRAAVGAPSSLAVETAQRFNLTLVGFGRDNRFNIYSGASRIQ